MMVRRNQSLFLNKKILGEVYESEMKTPSGIG